MKYQLKVIKKKEFEAQKEKHVHYTAAYRGRLFGVSTLRFADAELKDAISEKDNILTIDTDIEVLKEESVDELAGTSRTFLTIVPKSGLNLATF